MIDAQTKIGVILQIVYFCLQKGALQRDFAVSFQKEGALQCYLATSFQKESTLQRYFAPFLQKKSTL